VRWELNFLSYVIYAGHILRMEDEIIPKKILYGKFHKRRPVGKPRTRWKDVVRRDTSEILGIRGWGRRAEDGEECRRLLREARSQKAL
jgi:hypothetical protein